MMARQSFRIEGLSELKDALETEFSKVTATNVLKRALTEAAKPIEADAERLAPWLTGKLRTSIKIASRLSRRQKQQHRKESRVELFVGPSSLVQAITQEFGTVNQSPQPFMRPAWSANKMGALNSIKDLIKIEIEKARQRAARKTARLLAKTKA